jgi:hypothetical protein
LEVLNIFHTPTHAPGDQANEEIYEVALTKELTTNSTSGRYHEEQPEGPKVIELKDINKSLNTMQMCIP